MPEEPPQSKTAVDRPLARAGKAMLRPSRGQFVVAILLFITAMLLVMAVRTRATEPDYTNLRRSELIQLLDDLSGETRRLEADVRELQTTRDELASGAAGAEVAEAEAQQRLEQLRILSGTVATSGPGVVIVISDPANKVTPALLLDALEELRDAGAEVIEVNDEIRVVAHSWVAQRDDQIVMDDVALKRPIRLEVIGDPATLEAGARFRGGLVSEVEGPRVEGSVAITQTDEIVIESIVAAKENEFAKPK